MRDAYRVLFAPIALIGLIHIAGGAVVLFAPQAVYVSQLSGLMLLLGARPLSIAGVLIVVGALALVAELVILPPKARITLVAPQQIVLLVQALGVGVSAFAGAYPDGYVPVPGDRWASFWFIVGDQAALLLLCLSHTIELFFADPLGRVHARYAARLAAERAARRDAERALETYQETQFWLRLGKEIEASPPDAEQSADRKPTDRA